MSAPVARAIDVHKGFGAGDARVEALRGASLDVAAGELLALRGPSGSGKTTLLNMLGGLDRPDAGSVEVLGRDLGRLSDDQLLDLRRTEVAYAFQTFALIDTLTVRENVGLPLRLRRVPRSEREHAVGEVLAELGLDRHGNHRPSELSGGQRQRVALARALVARTRLLLVDEPTAQLDTETGATVVELIRRHTHAHGTATVLTTHDAAALASADRVLQIVDGRLV